MDSTKTLQIYIHYEALIGYKVTIACFKIWVFFLDKLRRNYTSHDFTLLHRLKDPFNYRADNFIAAH